MDEFSSLIPVDLRCANLRVVDSTGLDYRTDFSVTNVARLSSVRQDIATHSWMHDEFFVIDYGNPLWCILNPTLLMWSRGQIFLSLIPPRYRIDFVRISAVIPIMIQRRTNFFRHWYSNLLYCAVLHAVAGYSPLIYGTCLFQDGFPSLI